MTRCLTDASTTLALRAKLYAPRISVDGRLLWGREHVEERAAGALQQRQLPRCVSDGQGSAAFAPHDMAASTNPGQARMAPTRS